MDEVKYYPARMDYPNLCKPYSNADRIRSMSDEELCRFLGEYKFCDICEEGCDNCTYNGDCDKRLLEWLQQPAEEADNG